jgi:Na+-translocating ferredoxin:NAD+ oxidoreductase RnfG subunit
VYTASVFIPSRTATTWVLDLPPGTYTFALKAFNADGVYSGYSNAVTATVAATATGRLTSVRVPASPP